MSFGESEKKLQQLPHWAPEHLVGWANRAAESRVWDKKLGREPRWTNSDHLVIKAITDPEMERVWKSYKKRCYSREVVHKNGVKLNDSIWSGTQYQLIFGVDSDLNDPRPWVGFTSEQKRQELNKIVEATEIIGKAMAMGALRTTLLFLPNLLEKEAIDNTIETMPRHCEPDLFEELGEFWGHELALHAVPHVLLNCGTLYDILEKLKLESQASLEALESPQVIERPNTRNAQTTMFIRHACIWHVNKFGTPLYENVASLARVFIGEPITARNVIDSFRPIKDQEGLEDKWASGLAAICDKGPIEHD